jgi:cobalt-zinc-cadmium efflux system protein
MLSDALGSVGVILAAVLASAFDMHAADPVLSLLICGLIVFGSWGVLRDSTKVLLDFVPADLPQERVEAALRGLRGVQAVHDLHVWGTGSRTILTAHLVPEAGTDAMELLARAEHALRGHLGVHHTTIQIDPPAGDTSCEQQACTLLQDQAAAGHGHHHHHH